MREIGSQETAPAASCPTETKNPMHGPSISQIARRPRRLICTDGVGLADHWFCTLGIEVVSWNIRHFRAGATSTSTKLNGYLMYAIA
jgi:hypothetical protein